MPDLEPKIVSAQGAGEFCRRPLFFLSLSPPLPPPKRGRRGEEEDTPKPLKMSGPKSCDFGPIFGFFYKKIA